jgi:hypothetical protein
MYFFLSAVSCEHLLIGFFLGYPGGPQIVRAETGDCFNAGQSLFPVIAVTVAAVMAVFM